jgi:hypothetical protein
MDYRLLCPRRLLFLIILHKWHAGYENLNQMKDHWKYPIFIGGGVDWHDEIIVFYLEMESQNEDKLKTSTDAYCCECIYHYTCTYLHNKISFIFKKLT